MYTDDQTWLDATREVIDALDAMHTVSRHNTQWTGLECYRHMVRIGKGEETPASREAFYVMEIDQYHRGDRLQACLRRAITDYRQEWRAIEAAELAQAQGG